VGRLDYSLLESPSRTNTNLIGKRRRITAPLRSTIFTSLLVLLTSKMEMEAAGLVPLNPLGE
jgi:hypothetical protein